MPAVYTLAPSVAGQITVPPAARHGAKSLAMRPLAGIRIIDLTTNMSGPLATMVLADQGADVVKVEPPAGDAIRTVGTGHAGMSAYFANNNRGKRSIAIDLTKDAGRDVVRRLTADADVFAQNFRPGVVDRLGLSAQSLQAENPRLVYASISGFGTAGPLADAPAYDHVVQALSGFAAIQTAGTTEPSMVRHGVIDKATAYTLAQAITAALFQRERTGQGTRHRRVDARRGDRVLVARRHDGSHRRRAVDRASAHESQLPGESDGGRSCRARHVDGRAVVRPHQRAARTTTTRR